MKPAEPPTRAARPEAARSARGRGRREDFAGLLSAEVLDRMEEIGSVDVVVGVPSYNNAGTIGHVVRAVEAGLSKHFPDCRALLVNSDGGSTDGTPAVVASASIADFRPLLAAHPLHAVHKIVTPYHGIPGKGSALRTVLAIAGGLGAAACTVVDSDLRSITPEWMELLLAPVLREGFDFVAPLYHRHKYDGTITNSIVYPLTRALYGKRIRQPIGGDFGLSGALVDRYLAGDVWDTDVARFGIDIWMTTTAITGGFNVCQSFLGAKIHDAKDPGVDLSAMLTQVVGSVFSLMEANEPQWQSVRESTAVPLFGFEYAVGLEPVAVNVERLVQSFHAALRDLAPVWEGVFQPETYAEVQRLGAATGEGFRYPPHLWVRTVYDFAVAYHKRAMNRDHLLRSLTPLYLGRTASFVLETAQATAEEVERVLETLCREYETQKTYLIERW